MVSAENEIQTIFLLLLLRAEPAVLMCPLGQGNWKQVCGKKRTGVKVHTGLQRPSYFQVALIPMLILEASLNDLNRKKEFGFYMIL